MSSVLPRTGLPQPPPTRPPVAAARPAGATLAPDIARVLVVDDSAIIRAAVTRLLEADKLVRVVAHANNGRAAIDEVKRQQIDVVVLDIEMPVMDGMTALPELLRADPGLRIIMSSTLTTRGADIAMQALRLGASDYVPKPTAAAIADASFGAELVAKVKGLARLRRRARQPAASATAAASPALALRPAARQAPLLLAIGSSTGGPQALFTLVQALGTAIPVPVVLTQHMPATFTAILADHIGKLGFMPCAEARNGEMLLPGRIYLAPGSQHLLIDGKPGALRARLTTDPPENFCRPSVDPMLRSATEAVGGRLLVLMLTGMGHDGLDGTKAVVAAGGTAIAQDEASSIVWGMPGAVAQAGLCHKILPLTGIGPAVLDFFRTRDFRKPAPEEARP
jgi:two-component system chemotaxis response regulator CheB